MYLGKTWFYVALVLMGLMFIYLNKKYKNQVTQSSHNN